MWNGKDLRYFDHSGIQYQNDQERQQYEKNNIAAVKALNNGARFSIVFTSPLFDGQVCISREGDLHYALVCIAGGHILPYPLLEDCSGEYFRLADQQSSDLVFVPKKEFEEWNKQTFAARRQAFDSNGVTSHYWGESLPGYRVPLYEVTGEKSRFIGVFEAESGDPEDRKVAVQKAFDEAQKFLFGTSEFSRKIGLEMGLAHLLWQALREADYKLGQHPLYYKDFSFFAVFRERRIVPEEERNIYQRHDPEIWVWDIKIPNYGWVRNIELTRPTSYHVVGQALGLHGR